MAEIVQRTMRLPVWMRQSLEGFEAVRTRESLDRHRTNTVCDSARCPNRHGCFARKTATFMILGTVCTRRCLFCAVKTGVPQPVDAGEPERVAQAARELGLEYVVITSVTRDDLPDEGSLQFAATVRAVKAALPDAKTEVLTPDFHARADLITAVTASEPDVFNHNLETVERLQRTVRPQGDYRRSLRTLEAAKRVSGGLATKSGLMLGLGEHGREVLAAGRHLRDAGVDIVTLGQYLPPTSAHPPAAELVPPGEFGRWEADFRAMGFSGVFAAPQVRSSYHAAEAFEDSQSKNLKRGEACHD